MIYGLLFASLASICWGIAPILYKRALGEMGLFKANAFRGLGLLTVLVPVFFLAKNETINELLSLSMNSYILLVLHSLMSGIVGDLFYLAAIRNIGVSLSVPISSSYPLVVALTSLFWFGEVLTFSVLSGTLSIVAGIVLLNTRVTETYGAKKSNYLYGVASAFLSALCWGMGMNLNKYITLRGISPTAITFWRGIFFSLMAIALLPLVTRGEKEKRPVSFGGAFTAAAAGITALVLGQWFFVNAITIIPVNIATPIASSSPLIAAMFACAFMNESLRPTQWLGIVFVVVGAATVVAGV